MAHSPHRIRLRRPWRCESAENAVRWWRAFQRPTGLAGGACVAAVVEDLAAPGRLWLNGVLLGELAGADGRFDVTGRLAARNELMIEIPHLPPPASPAGDDPPAAVFLEITEPPGTASGG